MSKIIFEGTTSDGTPYLIRYPRRDDLQEMLKYINELSKEKTFITFQGEEVSLKEEEDFLNNALKKIPEAKVILLLAIYKNKVIGVSDVHMQSRVSSHIGKFGLSIAKEYRGKGIGKKLMGLVLDEARKNLKGLRILELDCFANNPIACQLYKSLGFKEYGRLPKGIAHGGEFIDDILMYYEIKT